jgi:hypothetical protein
MALLVFAIFIALPNSLTNHWGDATFVSLFCLSVAIFYWPEAYFRRRIAGGRRKRNLAANWTILMASTGAAAAFAQHESATLGFFRGKRWQTRVEMYLALFVFLATFCALWFVYAKVMNYRRLARNRSAPNTALR